MRLVRRLKNVSRLVLCLVVLSVVSNKIWAQTLNFKQFTVNTGLLSSTVYFTYQDSKGYIWFATEAGVNRFDGKTFESFTVDDGLSDNEILWIQEDAQHRIWFLTLNGQLSFYYNNKFYNPSNHPLLKKAITKASFVSFFEDSKRRIWLGTNQQEIVLIGKNLVRHYKLPSTHFLANSFIVEDKAGKIWVLNERNLFEVKEDRLINTPSKYYPASHKSSITDTVKKKTLYVSKKGLVEFNGSKSRLIRTIHHEVIKQGLGHFLVDEEGSLWLSTLGNGIYRFPKNNKPENFLPGRYVTHSIKDREGNIWVSTIGDGVFMLPAHTKNIIQFTRSSGLSDMAIHSIAKDSSNTFWLGLRKGGLNFLKDSKITFKALKTPPNPYNPIKVLTMDSENQSVWFITNNVLGEIKQNFNSIRYLTVKNENFYAVKSFSLGKNGQIAFALSGGVYIIHNKNAALSVAAAGNIPGKQRFFPLRGFATFYDSQDRLWFSNIKGLHSYTNNKLTDHSTISPLLTKRITNIKELPDGTIALATYGYGVILLRQNKIIQHITTEKGLTSNIVTRLLRHRDFLWAVTNKGVSKIKYTDDDYPINTYRTDNGLSSNEVNDILIDDKNIYLATNNGLTILQEDKISVDTLPPPLYLSNLKVDQKTVSDTSGLVFKHTQNNIDVDFTAINFNEAKSIWYRYKLRTEDPWTTIFNSSLNFGSLEPGKYQLLIQARSQYSSWSRPIILKFTIKPPFWRNWVFIVFIILLASALTVWAVSAFFKTQKIKEEEKLVIQNKITSLEQQALQAMMNPHFVFNVMNSIQHFINTRNDLAANKVLTGFARLIRKNMDVCTKSFITLEEEIEYLRLYLSLEALRFGERMNYHIEVDNEIDAEDVFLPSMLLQPFVENAIWHGIMPKEEGGKIDIRFIKLAEDSIEISIQDNGIGILNTPKKKDTNHVSRGMQLTTDRIKLLNKSSHKPIVLKVEQTGADGTLVKFIIPIT